jgi:MOSC domain-containing protein YiiM
MRTLAELEAGLGEIERSPKDRGRLEMIVRRPRVNEREVVEEARLTIDGGLEGDSWKSRSAHPEMQINIMNSRAIALVAQDRERWPLAGDQLFVDLDLSEANLPAGTRLAIGAAVLEVSAKPHLGCGKFASRFGNDATRFVNSPRGKELHLRGINARVVQNGVIRTGDEVRKLIPPS